MTTRIFIFQLNTCGYNPYVTSSLTSGWVCRLQLLLVLASAVFLRSESRGIHDHTLLSQIRYSPNPEGQAPLFISPRNRVALLYPRHWVLFSSSPTTPRATVEAFDPASTPDSLNPNEFTNEVTFITRGEPKRDHHLEQFACYYLCFVRCYEMCLAACYPATEALPMLTA
jgi:hypothetical protein